MYGLNSLIKMAVTLAGIALASHNVGPIISALRTAQLELIAKPLPTLGRHSGSGESPHYPSPEATTINFRLGGGLLAVPLGLREAFVKRYHSEH